MASMVADSPTTSGLSAATGQLTVSIGANRPSRPSSRPELRMARRDGVRRTPSGPVPPSPIPSRPGVRGDRDGGLFLFEGTVGQYRALLGHAARLSAYRL